MVNRPDTVPGSTPHPGEGGISDGEGPARVPWLAIAGFAVISCGLAWIVMLPVWLGGQGLTTPFLGLYASVMMFTPAAAALLAVFFLQHPRPARIGRHLGLWPLRPAGRTLGLTAAALFGIPLIIIAGAFLAAALGLFSTDLTYFSGFAAQLRLSGGGAALQDHSIGQLVALQLLSLPAAAIIPNSLLALGEELGWRGWLLPSLLPLGTWPALLITGALWGFWHAPLVLLGYNFGRTGITGVALMIFACMAFGVLFGWLRLRSASVWPSVIAHGALNAAGGFALVIISVWSNFDPVSSGPLGWATWIVIAAVVVVLAVCGQFSTRRLRQRLG